MTTHPKAVFLDRLTPPHTMTLVLMASVQAMAMNMFLPSLPAMTEHFQTDYRTMQLSVALYLGVNAFIQLLIGPLADRFGRRPVLLVGFAVFLVASLGCVFAPNAYVFLGFRMMQASVVVAMVLSRAIVRDMYAQDKAASMIGYVTMGMAVVPMITPAIGGYLDQHFGWQANFYALFLTGAAVMALIWADNGETNTAQFSSFGDQIRDYPILLRAPRFWGYALCAAFSSGAFFAYLGGAPYVGSEVFGMSPSMLGLFFGAPAIGYLIGNGITGRLAARTGINRLILVGSIIALSGPLLSISLFLVGLDTAFVFFGSMVLVGLGNGMVVPNATSGILSVRPQLAGTASGLGGTLMIGGGAALSALAGSMLGGESGALPLLWIMFAVTASGAMTILLVMRRARRMDIAG